MSDISIPGVTSRFNTDKMIEDLMKLERQPLDRIEQRIDTFQQQKTVWQDMNRRLSSLRDASRFLFSHQNPFNNRNAVSSAENILSASANRQASMEKHELEVVQVAQTDRFLSRSFSSDYEVSAGEYLFRVGDRDIRLNFRGGSLEDFTDALNRRGGDTLSGRVIRDTPDSSIFLLESLLPGASNKIEFDDNTKLLALDLGLIQETTSGDTNIPIVRNRLSSDLGQLTQDHYNIRNETLLVKTNSSVNIKVPSPIAVSPRQILELTVQINELPRDNDERPTAPSGPAQASSGSLDFEGIRIMNEASAVELPQWEEPEVPPFHQTLDVLHGLGDGSSLRFPRLENKTGEQIIRVPIGEYFSQFEGLQIDNKNTHREISVRNIKITDPTARDDYIAANPISEAQDAIIKLDGINITRPTNSIDDVIPGVTLTPRRPSIEPIELSIEPDVESVKDAIISLVGNYNQILTDIHILTSRNEDIISEISYYSDDEIEKARERLGLYQGDMTLNQIRNQMQMIMMDSYPNRADSTIRLLAQVGISTNTGGGGGVDASRLRGYLEINEQQLDTTLTNNLIEVRNLFAFDTDGDLLVDSGVAVRIDNFLQPYVQTGGIIANKITNLDSTISRENSQAENLTSRLESREQDLRRQYGIMEGTIQNLESSTEAIRNLNRQGD